MRNKERAKIGDNPSQLEMIAAQDLSVLIFLGS